MNLFLLILQQTITLASRKGGGALGGIAFYVIIVTLFTFALGTQSMQQHASAVMCVGILLSTITALPLFYERDYEDGMLEQYILQSVLLEVLVLAKLCGYWLATILPLLLITPLLALMAGLEKEQTLQLLGILSLASPTIISIASIGGALTLGNKRGGLLQALIVMPLYIPVLIFAASPDSAHSSAEWLLAAMVFATVPLSCFITAGLIRVSQD